ncbi:MAG: hypothetical protein RJA81_1404, partial [Planctomycetota bacterium]
TQKSTFSEHIVRMVSLDLMADVFISNFNISRISKNYQ